MGTAFISHSSRDDAYAAAVRRAVQERLEGKGYEVLVDTDALRPGDEWRSVLYQWLADCTAAVVLLGRQALASPWVRREVNILLWRVALGARVQVVPALLGDVRSADLKQAGLSELEPLQLARIDSTAVSDGDADAVAALIAARFTDQAAVPPDDPMTAWLDRLGYLLSKVDRKEALVDSARALDVEDERLDQVRLPDGSRYLAHQLLARSLDGRVYRAILKIAPFMESEPLCRLVPLVTPTWVDGETAWKLLTAAQRRDGAVVAVNARAADTAYAYIARASCCALEGFRKETVNAVTGEATVAETLAKCDNAVRSLLRVPPGFGVDEVPEPDDAAFLVLDPAGVPLADLNEVVQEVRLRYRWLTLFVLTGPSLPPPQQDGALLSDATVLTPALQDGEELAAYRVASDLRALPDALLGRAVPA